MNKLVVENLHLQYGDNPILKGVSMTLSPGEVVALLGASGSGKTTLLRSVAGLEQPSQGKIAIGESVVAVLRTGWESALTPWHPSALELPR